MAATFNVPCTASTQSEGEKELELALQSLSVGDDIRPRTPVEWIPFLHGKYCGTTSNSDRARVGRALSQLVVTGSYDNADLFVAREPGVAPPVTFAIDDCHRNARIQYKFDAIAATPSQTLTYMRCLASLAKRGFTLADMQLPKPASQLAALFLDGAATPAQLDRGLCASAAQHHRRVGHLLSTADAHAFLTIWIFVVLSLYSKPEENDWVCFDGPSDELVPVTSHLQSAGYIDIADFVAHAD